MSCGIYKITNMINNKRYIGKSIDLERTERHQYYLLESGKHPVMDMQNDFNKQGKHAGDFIFEIETECDPEELNALVKEMREDILPEYNQIVSKPVKKMLDLSEEEIIQRNLNRVEYYYWENNIHSTIEREHQFMSRLREGKIHGTKIA